MAYSLDGRHPFGEVKTSLGSKDPCSISWEKGYISKGFCQIWQFQGIKPKPKVKGRGQTQPQAKSLWPTAPLPFMPESILTSQAIQKKLTRDQHERDVR